LINNKLFYSPTAVLNPKLRLFCLPYAGGSSNTYLPWLNKLNRNVELVLVQLPGRGIRFNDKPHDSMNDVIQDLINEVAYLTSVPFVIFGHSLGSRVAFELCSELYRLGHELPQCLIASGSSAPHVDLQKKRIYDLPNHLFIEELKLLNGTPEEVLLNDDLMGMLTPLLRADFRISDEYRAKKIHLPFPIHVLSGSEDFNVKPHQLSAWNDLTKDSCSYTVINGDHFFIEKNRDELLIEVGRILNQTVDSLCGYSI